MGSRGQVTSADGSRIAFERQGSGAPVILVSGALQGRSTYRPLAEALSNRLTVINYDRRGRGDSADTEPYAVEREVEDLAALIAEAGGRASLYGHSSGAALVMHAAAHGLAADAVMLHEPPFGSGSDEEERAAQEEADRISTLLAHDRRADAVRSFLASAGLPDEVVDFMCSDPATLANAHSLRHDPFDVMGAPSRGGRTPAQQAAGISMPALVIAGGASPAWMVEAGRSIADALPKGRLHLLAGQDHIVPPDVLAPVIADFVTSSRRQAPPRNPSAATGASTA